MKNLMMAALALAILATVAGAQDTPVADIAGRVFAYPGR